LTTPTGTRDASDARLTRDAAAPTLRRHETGTVPRRPERRRDDRLRRKQLKLDLIYGAIALVLFGFIAFGIVLNLD
jgi:hypothetical protein